MAAAVAALASRRHGLVTRRDLHSLAVGDGSVSWWVRTGRLHRIHRGVYAVGHPVLTQEGRWMAAVLACSDGAVLSHRSAAALWGVGREGRRIDVSVPRGGSGPRAVAVHRPRRLERDETTVLRGIPTTTLPRTLVDLADVLTDRELSRAIHVAEVEHSLAARTLVAVNGRRGGGRLARVAGADRDRTRSDLERRFERLCARHGLPKPRTNDRVAGFEVDFHWRGERLVAETDGWSFHRTRRAFELDRRRDQTLARAGYRVLRFTHEQVTREPAEVAATLRAALG
jgi:very-short-patch-repair endonuclease